MNYQVKSVNSEVVSTCQFLAWKGFPRGVHATLTNPAWITHLLRNILSNYWCGMHRTCKNTSIKPDRRELMIRSEKYQKVIPVWPQLEATVPSDVVGRSSDCENRANEENENKLFWNGVVVLGLATSHIRKCEGSPSMSLHLDYLRVYIIYIYMYIVTSHLRTTAPRDCHCSAQLRPPLKGSPSRATASRYVYTGPGGVVFVGHRPPRDPGGPLLDFGKYQGRSFTSIQMFHTHTRQEWIIIWSGRNWIL